MDTTTFFTCVLVCTNTPNSLTTGPSFYSSDPPSISFERRRSVTSFYVFFSRVLSVLISWQICLKKSFELFIFLIWRQIRMIFSHKCKWVILYSHENFVQGSAELIWLCVRDVWKILEHWFKKFQSLF